MTPWIGRYSTYEEGFAVVSTLQEAVTTVEGRTTGRYLVEISVDGEAARIEALVSADGAGQVISRIELDSDVVVFRGDLAQFLGDARIGGNLILEGSLTRPAVAPGAFTAFDLIVNRSGFRVRHQTEP